MTTSVETSRAVQVRELLLVDLYPSSFNPRKTMDPVQLEELTRSIIADGIQSPLIVRPMSNGKGLWEIVAGHRRHAAASLAKFKTAPCIVRELTDDQAQALAIVDNLQREDMPALEEADAYEALRQQLGTVEAIAARVGKPIDYVTRRLKLVSLGEHSRRALAERLITIDHALLLSKLGGEDQDKHLKWTLDRNAGVKQLCGQVLEEVIKRKADTDRFLYWEPQSVLELKREIEQSSGRRLDKAPWDLGDAELLPIAGACTGCPSNTAHNTSLFGDLAIEEATCEDGACFERKREAFVERQVQSLRTTPSTNGTTYKVATVPKLSWKSATIKPRMTKDGKGVELKGTLKQGQWIEANEESCPNVMAGVTVDWNGDDGYSYMNRRQDRKPGELLVVCVTPGCKTHPKAYEKKPPAAVGRAGYDPKAEQEERDKIKPLAIAENKLRVAFVAAALEGITKIPASALRVLVLERLPSYQASVHIFNALLPGIVIIAEKSGTDSTEFARAAALASLDDECLQIRTDGYDDVDELRKELIKAVRELGYTGPDPWAKPAKAAKKAASVKKKIVAKKVPKKPAKKEASP